MKNTPLFTKGQRAAIILLLVLVVCVIGGMVYINQLPSKTTQYAQEAQKLQEEITLFENALYEKDRSEWTHLQHKHKMDTVFPQKYTLFTFNPNETDSATLVQLGISPYVARNIVRYRTKGGVFKKAQDLGKIYGMDSTKLAELMPYVHIPQDTTPTKRIHQFTSLKKDTILEINSADTAQLQCLKGIGPVYAQRIVYYRKQLGGFHHIEQIQEAIDINKEEYQYLSQHFTIDTTAIQRIPVNMASVERLKRHPYIDFYIAKSIYDTRRNAFELKSITELKGKEYMTDEVIKKLTPYLSFEKRNNKLYKQ